MECSGVVATHCKLRLQGLEESPVSASQVAGITDSVSKFTYIHTYIYVCMYVYMTFRLLDFLKIVYWWPDMVAPACDSSTLGNRGGTVLSSIDWDHPDQHGETPSLLKIQKLSDLVARAYNSSYSGGQGRRIAWTREAVVALSQDRVTVLQPGNRVRLRLKKILKNLLIGSFISLPQELFIYLFMKDGVSLLPRMECSGAVAAHCKLRLPGSNESRPQPPQSLELQAQATMPG